MGDAHEAREPLHVEITPAADHLRVAAGGAPSLGEFLSLLEAVSARVRQQSHARVLFDLRRVTSITSFTEQYAVGEAAARLFSGIAIASVVPPERITRTSERVGRKGGARLAVFGSEAEALDWLRQPHAGPAHRD